MVRHALLVGVVFALVAPAGAAAAWSPEARADYAFAVDYWGGAQPTGCIAVDRELVPPAFLLEGQWGAATKPPRGRRVYCTFYIRIRLPRCIRRQVIVHEYGHLLRVGHSTDPADIMFERIQTNYRPDLCPWQAS